MLRGRLFGVEVNHGMTVRVRDRKPKVSAVAGSGVSTAAMIASHVTDFPALMPADEVTMFPGVA